LSRSRRRSTTAEARAGPGQETKEQIKKLKFEKQDKAEQMQVNKKQIHLVQQQERLSEKDAL